MSDDDSSSGEDLPLSSLGRRGSARPAPKYADDDDSEEAEFQGDGNESEEVEFDDVGDGDDGGGGVIDEDEGFIDDSDDDDDEDDDDGNYGSDSDSDSPLSSLKSPAGKKAAAKKSSPKAAPKKKSSSAKKKPSSAKKKAATKKKPSNGSNGGAKSSAPAVVLPSMELYEKCNKGKLIRSLLARWWYAYEWPDPACLPATTPKHYDALDGIPGVYICTSGDEVGNIKDYRDHETAPCFRNLAKKSATELQEMLLNAIQRQRKALEKLEGEGTMTGMELRVLEKWANKLDCQKADKDAVKVLKAARLSLS